MKPIMLLNNNQEVVLRINMSKLTDTLKAALAKKQGKHHIENDDVSIDAKPKAKPVQVVANKPQKKVTGRGR